jgi:hypothetical protein
VQATARLVNIDITGDLVARNGSAYTVTANGMIYAVQVQNAKFTNKKAKVINIEGVIVGERVRIIGKHISGSTQITATTVKNLSR